MIMKFLKKRKTILLTFVLCVIFLLVFSQAAFAEGLVKLSASDVKGEVGEEVTVEITAEDALDHEGGQFDLSFDSDIVEPVSASRGALVPDDVSGNLFDYNLELADGELRLIWVIAEGCEDDSGVIGTINFEVLDDGETDLDFSNIVMAPDGFEATATSGSIESEDPVDELEAAIAAADAAIADLPDPEDITLADKEDVEAARALVDEAKALGAEDDDFEDLDKLLAAEARIAKLEAIKTADDAILALPSVDVLTLDDRPDVVAARALVNKAKDDHGAVDEDFLYLSRLEAAEGRIRELEGLEPTPPTGAINYMLPVGLMVIFAGLLAYFKRSQLATK